MFVYSCITATTLREIDAYGGFDEYITQVSPKKITDDIAIMYRQRISKAMKDPNGSYLMGTKKMQELLRQKYGPEYIEQLGKFQ